MTKRQRDYLQAIADSTANLGHAPSYDELATAADSSVTSVAYAVRRLKEHGLVDFGGPRTLRLTEAGRAALAAEERAA